MKTQLQLIKLSVLSILFFGIAGCQPSVDQQINTIVDDAMSQRSEILGESNGTFRDYKAYRDGDEDGIVYEYVYAKDVMVDGSRLSSKEAVDRLTKDIGNDPSTRKLLEQGIHVRFIYKLDDGTVAADVKITKDDLE